MTNTISAAAQENLAPANTGLKSWRQSTSNTLVDASTYASDLRSIARCMALTLAALLLVAAYVLVPLAAAVESVVSAAALAWGVSGAILLEVFLLTAFIVLKTEGREGGSATHRSVP